MTPAHSRALGLAAGFLADRLLGDPRRGHPVAGFGRAATGLEGLLYADRQREGVVFTTFLVGSAAAVGVIADRLTRDHPLAHALTVAATTWTVLGGRSLGREALAVSRLLEEGDIVRARLQVTHLVGRDPSGLGPDEIARATVESVAENTSDAVVGPLVAGALLGVPGLLAYRAANTLDAMVGHHSSRYERFGWASARLDDLLNVAPARLSGAFATSLAPLVGGRPVEAITTWRRDAAGHPSPNAGVVEAAFAGALGVTLGGRNVYGDQVEHRGVLGSGPPPGVPDVARAVSLADAVGWMALAVAVSAALAPRPRRRPDR